MQKKQRMNHIGFCFILRAYSIASPVDGALGNRLFGLFAKIQLREKTLFPEV